MTLLYPSTFAKSLDRLTAAEPKQVKVTTVDIVLDPAGNCLQLLQVERHLRDVAAARARDYLTLSEVAPDSEFLDDLN